MTDFQASLGYFQIKRYSLNLKRRKEIAKRYIDKLRLNKKITHMPYSKNCSYFVFQIFTPKRDKLINYLKKKKIQFSIHYANSLNQMYYYKKKYNLNKKFFQNSIKYGKTCISLPVYPKLKEKEVDYICESINRFSKND
jgi:dTDP-4-amino-4,6-dideoxygalactose transaminase